MILDIVRCLEGNYVYLLHDPESGDTTLIDASESGPVLAALQKRGWRLTRIYLTHHHADHFAGLAEILDALPGARPEVWGAEADAHRLPHLDRTFRPGDTLPGGAEVLDAPGHTLGHVAFHYPAEKCLFSADSLMTHGCGRLFEGTPQQMYDTIQRFDQLPADTRVLSGHDYARANLTFASRYAPDPAALAARQAELARLVTERLPTTGTTLASERLLNPYLRCHLPQVAEAAGVPGADPVTVFATIRRQKDNA